MAGVAAAVAPHSPPRVAALAVGSSQGAVDVEADGLPRLDGGGGKEGWPAQRVGRGNERARSALLEESAAGGQESPCLLPPSGGFPAHARCAPRPNARPRTARCPGQHFFSLSAVVHSLCALRAALSSRVAAAPLSHLRVAPVLEHLGARLGLGLAWMVRCQLQMGVLVQIECLCRDGGQATTLRRPHHNAASPT